MGERSLFVTRDDHIRTFGYANESDLHNPNSECLIGKCVGIGEFVVNVISSLGSGKTGRTFCVQVVEPWNQLGILMALKFRIGAEAVEQLKREATVMQKLAIGTPVPHAVSLEAFGRLKVPRQIVGWLLPSKSHTGEGLLVTMASGSRIRDVSFSNDTEKAIIRQQLRVFSDAMYEKGLMHADLTIDNIFWNKDAKQVTVIDFGNAVDKSARNASILQRAASSKSQNARHEMERFLENEFG